MRTAYLLAALTLIGAYPASPTWAQSANRLVAPLAAVPALLVGIQRIPGGRRAPWILLLTAIVLIVVANVVRLLPGEPAATLGDLVAAAGNVVLLLAALQLVRQQGPANLGRIIDTSIVALAVGGLLWALVLEPNLIASSQTHAATLSLFVVVFALSGVLGALGQMIIERPVHALRTLILALGLGMIGDVTMGVTTNPRFITIASMMILGAYTAIGLFGLDPTAYQMVTPAPARPDRLSPSRLVFLGLAVAALPVVAGTQRLAGGPGHPVLLVVSTASITTLVMLRIGQLSAQRDRANAALRHEAAHDPLTGLPNRKEFTSQVSEELTHHKHSAIIFCDLNQFKAINDHHGHARGDQVLIEVAQRLRSCVHANDLVSRLGGDEFVILLRDTTPSELQSTNQRISSAFARPVRISEQPTTIGVTTGTALAQNGLDADELIERADRAMYIAKTNNQTRYRQGPRHSPPD